MKFNPFTSFAIFAILVLVNNAHVDADDTLTTRGRHSTLDPHHTDTHRTDGPSPTTHAPTTHGRHTDPTTSNTHQTNAPTTDSPTTHGRHTDTPATENTHQTDAPTTHDVRTTEEPFTDTVTEGGKVYHVTCHEEGAIPHPGNIHKYIVCYYQADHKHWSIQVMPCPIGTRWHDAIKNCIIDN